MEPSGPYKCLQGVVRGIDMTLGFRGGRKKKLFIWESPFRVVPSFWVQEGDSTHGCRNPETRYSCMRWTPKIGYSLSPETQGFSLQRPFFCNRQKSYLWVFRDGTLWGPLSESLGDTQTVSTLDSVTSTLKLPEVIKYQTEIREFFS